MTIATIEAISIAQIALANAVKDYITDPTDHRYLEVIGCLQSLRDAYKADEQSASVPHWPMVRGASSGAVGAPGGMWRKRETDG